MAYETRYVSKPEKAVLLESTLTGSCWAVTVATEKAVIMAATLLEKNIVKSSICLVDWRNKNVCSLKVWNLFGVEKPVGLMEKLRVPYHLIKI